MNIKEIPEPERELLLAWAESKTQEAVSDFNRQKDIWDSLTCEQKYNFYTTTANLMFHALSEMCLSDVTEIQFDNMTRHLIMHSYMNIDRWAQKYFINEMIKERYAKQKDTGAAELKRMFEKE